MVVKKNDSNNSRTKTYHVRIYSEYIFTRTKDIIEDEHNQKIVFLFVGLTHRKYHELGVTVRKQVIPAFSKVVEASLKNIPEFAVNIPEGTIREKIKKEEFEELLQRANEDYRTLFFYNP